MTASSIWQRTLLRVLATGILVSIAVACASPFSASYVPDQWLYRLKPLADLGRTREGLAAGVVLVALALTLGLAGLWSAIYLSCFSFPVQSRSDRHALKAQPPQPVESDGQRVAKAYEKSMDDAARARHRHPWDQQYGETFPSWKNRQAIGQKVFAERLRAFEEATLTWYAKWCMNYDFLGQLDEAERIDRFTGPLNIRHRNDPDFGILHHSQNATIRKFLPRLPPQQRGWQTYCPTYQIDPLAGPFIKSYNSGQVQLLKAISDDK